MSGDEKIRVLLSAANEREFQALYRSFLQDPRFDISRVAVTLDMLREGLGQVEVAVVDAELLAPLGDRIPAFLEGASPTRVVLLLPETMAHLAEQFAAIPGVQHTFVKPVNFPELARVVYETGVAMRQAAAAVAPAQAIFQGTAASPVVVGSRVFAFIGPGGAGKTTWAVSFAWALKQRGIETLLMGFSVPDSIGARLKLPKAPNAASFFNSPGPDGFRDSIQKALGGDLDVVLSVNDFAEAFRISLSSLLERMAERAAALADEGMPVRKAVEQAAREVLSSPVPGTIASIIDAARNHTPPYAAFVLDLPGEPSTDWFYQPLTRAHHVTLVIRPTRDDVFRACEYLELITARVDRLFRVPREAIFGVLNFWRQGDMTADRVRNLLQKELGWAPPILATAPEDAAVPRAENDFVPAAVRSRGLAEAVNALTSFFYRGNGQATQAKQKGQKGRSFLGIKIRLT